MNNAGRDHNARGFTLVESLVVVGIVGLLLGILFTALRSSREAARRVVCMTNLRTLGAAIEGYKSEHDGLLPPGRFTAVSIPAGWDELIVALTPHLGGVAPTPDGSEGYVPTTPWACPSDPYLAEHEGCSYMYAAAEVMSIIGATAMRDEYLKMQPRWPIVSDALRVHPGGPRGPAGTSPGLRDRNVLRADGSIGWAAEP